MAMGQYIFTYGSTAKSWTQAKKAAGDMGGQLASVNDKAEFDFFVDVLKTHGQLFNQDVSFGLVGLWIGLSHPPEDRADVDWRWEDGTVLGRPEDRTYWNTWTSVQLPGNGKGSFYQSRYSGQIGFAENRDSPHRHPYEGYAITSFAVELDAGLSAITGGRDNDIIFGGAIDNVLRGLSGDDTLHGGAGADKLFGGAGYDVLHGGAGNDELYGEKFNDLLLGGEGDDLLFGGAGDDGLVGEEGNDTLRGGAGNDTVDGNEGNDELFGDGGDDALFGNEDDDILHGGSGEDLLAGGEGDDVLYGDVGDDVLIGGAGNDTLYGGNGADTLYGGERDVLYGGAGRDTFVFGSAPVTGVRILDLQRGETVDLSGVDASVDEDGDQAFTLVSAFTSMPGAPQPGQLIVSFDGFRTNFAGDTDGDAIADFVMYAIGNHVGTIDLVL